ncbi:hypothetical protein OV079_41035 [Nannocystis pusilla]|uniref:Uncharacterized protein n=1 Tax=Nannocystis pusilla TaxID=889268 RepID=A0A9X3EXH0_9BACT|nr:hypothetical protein [Nannocystis pusilla]MCY1011836.1 hypothetical protein [Nannocystis pusilla]
MSDHQHAAPAQQPLDRGLHLVLGHAVDARGRLVEDEQRRLARGHPRERQQLRLAGRQVAPALAHHEL